jgi:sporulation protein YlmC with PRC-barrel domain
MKKHVFRSLWAMVLLFPAAGAWAQGQADSGAEKISARPAEQNRIRAFRARDIIGSRVINLDGQQVGTITNLVIDIDTGKIVYAALEFGGFLGLRDKLFAVPWQSLAAVPAEGVFILDQSKKTLQKAPGFPKDSWPDIGDKQWRTEIYQFYKREVPSRGPYEVYRRPAEDESYPYPRHPDYPGYASTPYHGIWRDLYGEMFNPQTIETVTGRVVRLEYRAGIKLMIFTDAKKPVVADLGPAGYFENQGRVLKPGNTVTLTGSMITVDDTPLMIATNIKEGNVELRLRDEDGYPVWLGWKKIK